MKTAFSTLACPTLGLEALLKLAERNGMDAVEIRLDKQDRLCGYDLDTVWEAKALLADSRTVISDLATGIFFSGGTDKTVEVEYCARLAHALGVPALRVFVNEHAKRPVEITDAEMNLTAASLRESADVAARYGVALWIETHSAYSTGKSVAALIQKVQRDNVRVIWDVMHSIEFGELPKESVECLGDLIAHVHLKDGVPPTKEGEMHYRLTALGEGCVPFGEILQVLSDISYHGYLSLEWELMWHPELGECYPSTDALLEAYKRVLGA